MTFANEDGDLLDTVTSYNHQIVEDHFDFKIFDNAQLSKNNKKLISPGTAFLSRVLSGKGIQSFCFLVKGADQNSNMSIGFQNIEFSSRISEV